MLLACTDSIARTSRWTDLRMRKTKRKYKTWESVLDENILIEKRDKSLDIFLKNI